MSKSAGRPRVATAGDSASTEKWWEQDARLLLFVLLIVTLFAHLLLLWINRENIARGSYDFVASYSAAQLVTSGHGENLYNIATQRQFQQQFPRFRENPLLFIHPPFEVLVYLPLAYFSYPTAFVLWTVVNLAALTALAILLLPTIYSLRKSLGSGLPILLLFSFFPVWFNLIFGQDSILFLLLYALVFLHLRQGNDATAGVFAALCLFHFQLMIPLLLAFALRKRWKVLSAFLAGSAGLALLSVLLTGWGGPLAYVGLLRELNEAAWSNPANRARLHIHPEMMPNFRGFFYVHCAGRIPDSYVVLLTLALSLLLLVLALGKGIGNPTDGQTNMELPFALHTTVTLLVSYYAHLHDVSLLLLPLLLVANHLAKEPTRRSPLRLGLLLLVVALSLSPTYVLPFVFGQASLLALPLLAFALLIAAEISREKKRVPASV